MTHTTATLVYDIRQSRYLNITGRCTLQCVFCPKHNGSKQIHQYQLALDHQPKRQKSSRYSVTLANLNSMFFVDMVNQHST